MKQSITLIFLYFLINIHPSFSQTKLPNKINLEKYSVSLFSKNEKNNCSSWRITIPIDLNKDGHVDFVTTGDDMGPCGTNGEITYLNFFENNTKDEFVEKTFSYSKDTLWCIRPDWGLAADFNADGVEDLLMTGEQIHATWNKSYLNIYPFLKPGVDFDTAGNFSWLQRRHHLYLSQPDGSFKDSPEFLKGMKRVSCMGMFPVDYNKDGFIDLINSIQFFSPDNSSPSGWDIEIFINNQGKYLERTTPFNIWQQIDQNGNIFNRSRIDSLGGLHEGPDNIKTIDINNDGFFDLLLHDRNGNSFYMLSQNKMLDMYSPIIKFDDATSNDLLTNMPGSKLGVRGFYIADLKNDGGKQVISYWSNGGGDYQSGKKLYQLIKVFNVQNSSLVDVSSTFFQNKENVGLNYGAGLLSIMDLDSDGFLDLYPKGYDHDGSGYQGFNGKDSIMYFKNNKGKFELKSLGIKYYFKQFEEMAKAMKTDKLDTLRKFSVANSMLPFSSGKTNKLLFYSFRTEPGIDRSRLNDYSNKYYLNTTNKVYNDSLSTYGKGFILKPNCNYISGKFDQGSLISTCATNKNIVSIDTFPNLNFQWYYNGNTISNKTPKISLINEGYYQLLITDENNCSKLSDTLFFGKNIDVDKDGVIDCIDNCPKMYNPSQDDIDKNGVGDACETVKYNQMKGNVFYEKDCYQFYEVANPFYVENKSNSNLSLNKLNSFTPFDREIIPVDINNDGLMDLVAATGPNEYGKNIEMGHLSIPVYFINQGNMNFKAYMNPNYFNYSIFHGIQNYDLIDVDNDGKNEIFIGGEHYHLENVIPGMEDSAKSWLSRYHNHIPGRDYGRHSQSKLNRYYSFDSSGLMIDNFRKINYSSIDTSKCPSKVFNSIIAIGSGDIDNDGDMDEINFSNAECDGPIVNVMKNDGQGNFNLKRFPAQVAHSEGRIILKDITGDGYVDIIGIGNKYNSNGILNKNSDLFYYPNKKDGSFDFCCPIFIDKISDTSKLSKCLRNYKVQDLNKDGIDEILIYATNLYATIGAQIYNDPTSRKSLEPFNLVSIYTLSNGSLSNVTSKYLDSLGGFERLYLNHSGMQFTDVNGDGFMDLYPYTTEHAPYQWNTNDDMNYYQWDTILKKFILKDFKGFNSMVNGTKYQGHFRINGYDLIDVDNDGVNEFIKVNPDKLVIIKRTSVTTPSISTLNLCTLNQSIKLDIPSNLSINWYTDSTTGIKISPPSQINPSNKAYYISYSNNTGCESKRSKIQVVVSQTPITPVVRDTAYCLNTRVDTLRVLSLPGNKVLWYGTDSTQGVGSEIGIIPSTKSVGALSYYVSQKSSISGCESPRAKITVKVNPTPAKPNYNTNKFTFCSGDSLKLSVTNVNKGDTLKWYFGTRTDFTNVSNKTFTDSTKVFVIRTDSLGCSNSSDTASISILERPSKPTISWNGNEFSTASTYSSYQWLYNDSVILGANSSQHKPANPGNYKVRVGNTNQCTEVSSAFNLLVTSLSNPIFDGKEVKIYPNPALSKCTIDLAQQPQKIVSFRLFTNAGAEVGSWSTKQRITEIDLDYLPKGNYIIEIRQAANKTFGTIIKN